MKTTYKYLCFEELEAKTKTKLFTVENTSGSILGHVKWYAPWRKYCLFTDGALIFDAGCLADIQDFLNRLMIEKKEELEKNHAKGI
jgi:hypothetical protein